MIRCSKLVSPKLRRSDLEVAIAVGPGGPRQRAFLAGRTARGSESGQIAPNRARTSGRHLSLLVKRPKGVHDLVELNDATDRTLPQSGRSFDRACIRPRSQDSYLFIQRAIRIVHDVCGALKHLRCTPTGRTARSTRTEGFGLCGVLEKSTREWPEANSCVRLSAAVKVDDDQSHRARFLVAQKADVCVLLRRYWTRAKVQYALAVLCLHRGRRCRDPSFMCSSFWLPHLRRAQQQLPISR